MMKKAIKLKLTLSIFFILFFAFFIGGFGVETASAVTAENITVTIDTGAEVTLTD